MMNSTIISIELTGSINGTVIYILYSINLLFLTQKGILVLHIINALNILLK